MPSSGTGSSGGVNDTTVVRLNTTLIDCPHCRHQCLFWIAYTTENFGRLFYRCNVCDFFKWWSDVHHPSAYATNHGRRVGRGAARPPVDDCGNLHSIALRTDEHVIDLKHAIASQTSKVQDVHGLCTCLVTEQQQTSRRLARLMAGVVVVMLLFIVYVFL